MAGGIGGLLGEGAGGGRVAEFVGVGGHGVQGDGVGGRVVGVGGQVGGGAVVVLGERVAALVGAHVAEQDGQLGAGGQEPAVDVLGGGGTSWSQPGMVRTAGR